MKKILMMGMLFLSLLLLTGCRTRVTETQGRAAQGQEASPGIAVTEHEQAVSGDAVRGGASSLTGAAGDEPSAATTRKPDAEHREYDENASAEIVPGAARLIGTDGEGNGASVSDQDAEKSADLTAPRGERTASQTVSAEEADRMGTAEDAPEADTRLTYYTVLLQERVGALFECKRQYAYWEQPEDCRTVYKTSDEHQLIMQAGCYDVSARLLEENLTVTPGWVVRKDPGVIVKVVDQQVLGFGVTDASAARQVYAALVSRPDWSGIDAVKHGRVVLISSDLLRSPHTRMAAMLVIAKIAMPDTFADVELDAAMNDLLAESAGTPTGGLLYYIPEK